MARPRPAAKVPPALRRRYDCSHHSIDALDTITLRPARASQDTRHMVYLHGGAYVSPLVKPHWSIIAALMRRVDVAVTVPMYPLAPEFTVDDAVDFLDKVIAWGTDSGERAAVLCGDSAGGGLALSYALRQRDTGAETADAVILFSPWLDVTLRNPLIADIAPRDVMLNPEQLRTCGQWWAGSRSTTDPAVSPLRASLAGLPQVHTFIGDHDILLPDAELMHRSIQHEGGKSTLTIAKGGFHVYVGAPWIPESRQALNRAAQVIASI
ncbi:alpha/beta hydrolase [Mycobacteroides salmoniphilum]|uniref:alpha/beta hydrolase n=1 Tax=Mycobacteroides salmoniphilum TaxID=404941 RepID=UPI0012FFA02B|nr:alpha/beta hydrolase [Mycobacteroides salmoniphilum]